MAIGHLSDSGDLKKWHESVFIDVLMYCFGICHIIGVTCHVGTRKAKVLNSSIPLTCRKPRLQVRPDTGMVHRYKADTGMVHRYLPAQRSYAPAKAYILQPFTFKGDVSK